MDPSDPNFGSHQFIVHSGLDGFGIASDLPSQRYFGSSNPQDACRKINMEWTSQRGAASSACIGVHAPVQTTVQKDGVTLISLRTFIKAVRGFYDGDAVLLATPYLDCQIEEAPPGLVIHGLYLRLRATIKEFVRMCDMVYIEGKAQMKVRDVYKEAKVALDAVQDLEREVWHFANSSFTEYGKVEPFALERAVRYGAGAFGDKLWLAIRWTLLFEDRTPSGCAVPLWTHDDPFQFPMYLRPAPETPKDYIAHLTEMTQKLKVEDEDEPVVDGGDPEVQPQGEAKVFSSVEFARAFYKDCCRAAGIQPIDLNFLPRRCYNTKIAVIKHAIPKKREDGSSESSAQNECIAYCRRLGLAMFAYDLGGEKDAKHRVAKGYFVGTYTDARNILLGQNMKKFRVMPDKCRETGDFRVVETRNRYLYEFLLAERPTYPYMDVDIELDLNPHMDGRGDDITRAAIALHTYMLRRLHGVEPQFSDYLILSADKRSTTLDDDGKEVLEGKISRHIICKKFVFATMLAQRFFMNYLYSYFETLCERSPEAPKEDDVVLPLKGKESSMSDDEPEISKADSDAISDEEREFLFLRVTNKKGMRACAIDVAVYKDNQLFRPAMCSKAPATVGGSLRFMRLSDMNEHPLPPEISEDELFLYSLVQRLDNHREFSYDSPTLIDFHVSEDVQIPLVNFKVGSDGEISELSVTNPGDEYEKGKQRDKKRKNNAVTDLARKRISGSGAYNHAPLKQKEILVNYLKTTECGVIWSGRWNVANCTVKRSVDENDGRPRFLVQPECQIIAGRECPCLLKTYNDNPDFDESDPKCVYETHGGNPIELWFTYGWDPMFKRKKWKLEQKCHFRCNQFYPKNGKFFHSMAIKIDPPAALLDKLGLP